VARAHNNDVELFGEPHWETILPMRGSAAGSGVRTNVPGRGARWRLRFHRPALVDSRPFPYIFPEARKEAAMTFPEFSEQLEARIAKYDLLCHPFYKAWAAGELTREELRAYAAEYYPQVAAFPGHLQRLALRTQDGALRGALVMNRADELGADYPGGRAHEELWLDFAEGMGAEREQVRRHTPMPEVQELIAGFRRVAHEGSPAAALATFYAYESQVPRIGPRTARVLRRRHHHLRLLHAAPDGGRASCAGVEAGAGAGAGRQPGGGVRSAGGGGGRGRGAVAGLGRHRAPAAGAAGGLTGPDTEGSG
jgi:hypothetical protein